MNDQEINLVKEELKQYQNVFACIYNGKYSGMQSENVFTALKFIDSKYKELQDKLPPKNEDKCSVEANGEYSEQIQPEVV